MRCIISKSTNPHFNLAAEEYFLKNSLEEMFFLYINDTCIVVGKHQNLLSEINLKFALENGIKLARRISGGGTVYQDLNNLNFSFIHNCTSLEKINFSKFTYPILDALRDMGLEVEFSGRNDLLLDSKKISGNAMHIFKTRVLSHGTLLFNTDLSKLSAALNNNTSKYLDKSIKSVRSKVANISSYLDNSMSLDEFSQILFRSISEKTENPNFNPITESDADLIKQLSKEKFESWEWIYGYSPKYLFRNSFTISNIKIEVEMYVEKGVIRNVNFKINSDEDTVYQNVSDLLLNVKHDYHEISKLLTNDSLLKTDPSLSIPELINNLF